MIKTKIVASWATLITLARAEAKASKAGDYKKHMKAKDYLERYRKIFLSADRILLPADPFQ